MAGEDGKWGEFVMFVEETLSEEEEQVDDESKINKFIEDVQNMVCTVAQRPFVAKEAARERGFKDSMRNRFEKLLSLRERVGNMC